MYEPLFVPETIRAHALLAVMKRARSHVAIAVDEYGVTAGLVTLRDLITRIAGELPDENEPVEAEITWLADGTALVDGRTLVSDVESQLGTELGDGEFDTIGGLIFGRLGRRPAVGDAITAGDYQFTVEEVDGLRIARIRISRTTTGEVPAVFWRESL
jgi:CBS domain containing-hemolysin-like protein